MKIGIVTFTEGSNYGQRLQNLALQIFLEDMKYEVHTIESFDLEKKFISKIKNIIKFIINYQGARLLKQRENAFKEFNKANIKFSKFSMNNKGYFKNINIHYDYFICGSDQIWNPNCPMINGNYFLQFADFEKRIAFAPSFAVEYIPEHLKKQYIEWINGIKFLSIREEKGVQIIKELCEREAVRISDPTFLVPKRRWDNFVKKPLADLPNEYYVTYFLGEKRNYKKFSKIKCLNLNNEVALFNYNYPAYFQFCPSEFLYIIKNATYIITDSFHGAVFSIIYHKQFVVNARKDDMEDMSSRILELLKRFGMEDRFCLTEENTIKILESKINYMLVDEIIEKERKRAVSYWNCCVEGEKVFYET